MGTISDKLMRIINTKEDIRRALISKGYDVPTSIPFKEYAKMILDLPCNADSFPDIEGIVARYSALGLTNEQMAENPVWKDLTGNGHDLQMKNFAWGGMSGVNGYVQNFNYFRNNATVDKVRKQYPWLFPDQAWTVVGKTNEDEDRATIANITGNGNDLVLSNFGFAEGSGYGLYAQNYISYAITNRAVYTKTNSSIHVTKSITAGVNFTESARDVTIPSYRIKVTGIQSGQEMIYRGSNNTFLTNIPSDGIYVLPAVENGSNLGFQFVSYTGDCDITIEQIPEYEGYLVTDGVDDRVQDSSFKLNKDWTLVGEWVFLNQKATNAGITKPFSFVVYNRTTGLSLFINTGTSGITIENVKSIKAICSDGRIYFDDWSEMLISKDQDITSSTSVLSIGFNGTAYTQIAFKNLGIYNNQLLSKDECIKAYNYLQTLKSK